MNKHDAVDLKPCTHMQTLVSRRADGELSGLSLTYTNWHIAQCPRCQAGLQNLQVLKRRLGELDGAGTAPDALPPDSWHKVNSEINRLDTGSEASHPE